MSESAREAQRTVKTTQWDGFLREGPGATISAVPVIEVDGHGAGHALEPEYKRPPIGPDHILYPILVSIASFPMLLGGTGPHVADELPEDETHPFFPDHFWPYPVIMVMMLIGVGLLSAFVQQNVQLEQPADPRATGVLPRPDWYFLWLFQSLKLANEFVMAYIVPAIIVTGLLLWPFIDKIGCRIAPRLNWATWPVPGRNVITGTGWVIFLGLIVLLTFWALAGITILGISGG